MQPPQPPPSASDAENFDSLPDSQSFETKCSLNVLRRREPLGASANKPDKKELVSEEVQQASSPAKQQQQQHGQTVQIVIPNEIGERRKSGGLMSHDRQDTQ